MLRYFFVIFISGVILTISLAGFRGIRSTEPPIQIFPDMDDQPKYRPQHESLFFADGRSARAPVEGTVPLGYTLQGFYDTSSASNSRVAKGPSGFAVMPDYHDTGRMGAFWGDGIPLDLTKGLLERGRERYNIHCSICHGAAGLGNGVIKSYGLSTIASLQDDRIRTMPDGEIFNTITHGKNTMNAYGSNVAVEDRWAIIAWLRVLQRSQHGSVDDVPAASRAELDKPAAPAAGGASK